MRLRSETEPTEGRSVSVTNDETVTPPRGVHAASDDLPAHLDDRARLAAWQDLLCCA